MDFYKLNEKKMPVRVDLFEWTDWILGSWILANPIVARNKLADGRILSTEFLGVAHGQFNGEPVLFETVLFDKEGSCGILIGRACTWAQAECGHFEQLESMCAEKGVS